MADPALAGGRPQHLDDLFAVGIRRSLIRCSDHAQGGYSRREAGSRGGGADVGQLVRCSRRAGYGSPASSRGTIAVNPAITKPNSAITPMMCAPAGVGRVEHPDADDEQHDRDPRGGRA